ncbi:TetR/AcrR family transcriptional regulator [Rhodococcus sp. 05-340-1]|uniref:TetR/AcrR family transcriptional regulator n=1 Tax=Nocardiaceae TaxID=85025 RepID=UPI0009EA1B6D|nr:MULTISPECIES: TetR/AcrR family transcriptional regulator [Rhodococcus]OZC87704.1 TetR/AcrR family transcriptional regulator [Rhodococcus sp. 06-412-2C]OZC96355.1 TetR/AcrR family transcriptional regulator [Rhodococcus sp. 06-412-2B]OZD65339.1 TetR/AcrR family transcriptional regulator [Rhodococcus sp. 05-340-2]OZD74615.1 TetR/AcrR family transcriptional regulator [Rhodococcus sp. 05-340-1]OZD86612.1 TetR/AcrR family transcriptional regulator [Rhodococcus sp. 05-339-2]
MTDSASSPPRSDDAVPRSVASVPADARERLIRALEESIESNGYRNTTVADIVKLGRASRRTFYRVFATKDDVFVALMDDLNNTLMVAMQEAVDPHSRWRDQVDAAITTYFDYIDRRPAVYLCSLQEFPYLGDIAEPVIRRGSDAFAELIHRMTDNEEFRRAGLAPATRLQSMMVMGALDQLVAEILQTSGHIRDGLALAIASTTALLAVEAGSTDSPNLPAINDQPRPATRRRRST